MVQKKSGKWRMCIDFTSLNKAYPKNNFSLPRIDCFSGYHQIYMKEEDKASTSFITPFGTYCFIRMLEGLKNVGSTFSRLTKRVLESQVGHNIFTYVDDFVVMSKNKEDHLADLVETFARIAKWATELSGYNITFEPRIAIKSQVLSDFIIDWTGPTWQQEESPEKVWTIHCDGVWCHAGAGVAAIITSPRGVKYRYAARLSFALESDRCTNNIAEYEAVILGLRKLRALGVTTCIVRTDSKVVAGQVEKEYSAKDPALMQYLTAIRNLEKQFKGYTLQHVDRAKNEEANTLAKVAAKGEALPSDVFYHVIGTPAVRNPEGLQITNDAEGHRIINLIMAEDWRAPITLYLQGHYIQEMSMRPSASSTEAGTSHYSGVSCTRRGSVSPC
jgi:ribonuclease HI